MKQIDQYPLDYRARPVKSEPVLKPGAQQRIGYALLWFFASIGIAVTVNFFFGEMAADFGRWFSGLFFS